MTTPDNESCPTRNASASVLRQSNQPLSHVGRRPGHHEPIPPQGQRLPERLGAQLQRHRRFADRVKKVQSVHDLRT